MEWRGAAPGGGAEGGHGGSARRRGRQGVGEGSAARGCEAGLGPLGSAMASKAERAGPDAGEEKNATGGAVAGRRVAQLELQLSYVRWLRSQNQSRMRQTIAYTRELEERDSKEFPRDLERSERERLVEQDEYKRPLSITSEMVDQYVQSKLVEARRERERKATAARALAFVSHTEEERSARRVRQIKYRETKHKLEQVYEAQRALIKQATPEEAADAR